MGGRGIGTRFRRGAFAAAALFVWVAPSAEAMEPPPPNPRATYIQPQDAAPGPTPPFPAAAPEVLAPPPNPLLGEVAAGAEVASPAPAAPEGAAGPAPALEAEAAFAEFPPLAPGVVSPPPNPRRGEGGLPAVASPPPQTMMAALPGVRAPPPRPGRIPERSASSGRGVMLLGIFGSEDAPRAILRLSSGAVHRASVGQTVAGVTVTRIADGVVSVQAGSRASTLRMP